MLHARAYATLEHEYTLIVKKGPKREFKTDYEKVNRRESALFWEERIVWYSDVWTDIIDVDEEATVLTLYNGPFNARTRKFDSSVSLLASKVPQGFHVSSINLQGESGEDTVYIWSMEELNTELFK